MGKISGYAKAVKKVPTKAVAKVRPMPPPQSENEAPDAAPIAAPAQVTSVPKMASGDVSTGLSMRKPIKG